jgi:hypothetical protein
MNVVCKTREMERICEAKGILLFHISSNCISCFKVHFMCALPSHSPSLHPQCIYAQNEIKLLYSSLSVCNTHLPPSTLPLDIACRYTYNCLPLFFYVAPNVGMLCAPLYKCYANVRCNRFNRLPCNVL